MTTDATVLAVGVTTDGVTEGTGQLADLETQAGKTEAATDKFAASLQRSGDLIARQMQAMNSDQLVALSDRMQKLVDQTDPLSAKLRQLQNDFAQLNREVAAGAGAGSETAIDATYARLNAEIAQTKQAMAGADLSGGFGKAAVAAEGLNLATAGVTREFIVLGREAMTGNFSRIPGSLVVMAERTGNLTALLSASTLVWGLIAGAVALFITALVKGSQETQAFNEAIVKSGNISGQTADSMLQLSRSVADTTNTSLASVKTLVEQLVSSGKIGAQSIDEVAQAAAAYAQATGDDLKKVGPEFVKFFDDPVSGAAKLNEQMHFLTVGQLAYIQTLVQTGQEDQARLYLADQLIEHLKGQESQLGLVQRAWNAVKEAAGAAWDAMEGIGRPTTPAQALANAQALLDRLTHPGATTNLSSNPLVPTGTPTGSFTLAGPASPSPADVQRAQQMVDNAQEMVRLVNQQADAQARIAQQNALEQKLQEGLKNTDNERVKALENEVDLYNKQRDALARSGADLTSIDQKIADDNKKIQDLLNPKQVKESGFNAVQAALAAMDKEVVNAQIALDNVGATIDERTTPAMKKLADLENSPVWSKMTAAQKDHAIASAEDADALQKQATVMQAGLNAANAYFTSVQKTTQGLQEQNVKLQAEIDSLIQYGKANTDSATATTQFKIANDANLATMTAIAVVMPAIGGAFLDVADAKNVDALATAKDHDALVLLKAAATEVNTEYAKAQDAFDKTTQSIENQAGKLQEQAKNLGLTKEQIDQNKLANDALKLSIDQRALSEAQADVNQLPEVIAGLQARVKADQDLVNAEKTLADKQTVVDVQKAWGSVFDTLVNDGVKFFDTFETKGHDAWKTIADDLVKQITDALIKLALQQFILNVTANTSLAGAAQQAFGQSTANNPILSLLGNNSLTGPGGPLSFLNPSNAFGSFATSGIGQTLGLSTAGAGILGTGAGEEAAASIPAALGPQLTGFGSVISSVLPFLPVAAIALPFLTGLFGNKNPSPAQGQFQISTGTTGFEDNAYTQSPFGNLGFNDANTQQFSGQGAQVFNQFVATTLQAFQTRLSGAQSQQLATNLQGTSFPTFSGTYTTADFINKYGGQILQQITTAAFQVLDPALADVAKNFSGTADQVATFTNSLLAVYDATKQINNAGFTKNVDAALQGADQATADKVVAFVTIVQSFGTSIDGLGTQLEKLDPGSITKFIDALGGAQQAVTTMAYIQQNFTTSADKASEAQAQLNQGFTALGIAIPQTHAQFLAILNSFDLTTDAGRQMYAAVAALAPLFVQVHGTADQAASSVQKLSDYFKQLGQNANTAAQPTPTPVQAYAFAQQTFHTVDTRGAGADYLQSLGITNISQLPDPHDTAAWTNLEQGFHGTTEQVQHFTDRMNELRGALLATADGVTQTSEDFYHDTTLFTAAQITAHDRANDLAAFKTVGDALGVTITGNVDQYKQLYNQLVAQYGINSAQVKLFLSLLPDIDNYNQALQTQSDVLTTSVGDIIQQADSLAGTLVNHFADLANQSTGDFGQKLGIQIGLINDAIKNANPASFTSTLAFTAYVNTLKGQLPQLTSDLTQFTILSAKYGSAEAEQLVQLEDWYTQEQKLFAGNADALTAAKQVFDQKWQDIINGTTSGVSGTLTALQQLQQGIAKYLQGLQTSSLSPLTPTQQLSQAQSAYVEDLLKAQSGDQTALGDITTTADAYLKQAQSYYASSGQYVGIFDSVTQALGHLAGTTPGGLTLPQTTDQKIAGAMPTNGTVASNTDVKEQTTALITALQEATGEVMKNSTNNATKTGSLVASGLRRREVTVTPK